MTGAEIADAIAQALLQGGRLWLTATIGALMPALFTFALTLQLARPYVLRLLGKLSLRLAADVWWLGYVLVRDLVLTFTLGLSVVFLMPDLLVSVHLPLTAPLSTLCMFWTVAAKLRYGPTDDLRAHRVVTAFLVAAATFYFVPQTLAIEAGTLGRLAGFTATLDSARDPAWAGAILGLSYAAMGVTALLAFTRVVLSAGPGSDERRVAASERAAE